jgi:hypothetical protein
VSPASDFGADEDWAWRDPKGANCRRGDGEADDGYAEPEPEIVIEDRIVLPHHLFKQSDQCCTREGRKHRAQRYPGWAGPPAEPWCRQYRADDQMHQNAAAADCGCPVSKAKRGNQVDESSERTGECQQDDERPIDGQSPMPSLQELKFTHRGISLPPNSRKFKGTRECSMAKTSLQALCGRSAAAALMPAAQTRLQ